MRNGVRVRLFPPPTPSTQFKFCSPLSPLSLYLPFHIRDFLSFSRFPFPLSLSLSLLHFPSPSLPLSSPEGIGYLCHAPSAIPSLFPSFPCSCSFLPPSPRAHLIPIPVFLVNTPHCTSNTVASSVRLVVRSKGFLSDPFLFAQRISCQSFTAGTQRVQYRRDEYILLPPTLRRTVTDGRTRTDGRTCRRTARVLAIVCAPLACLASSSSPSSASVRVRPPFSSSRRMSSSMMRSRSRWLIDKRRRRRFRMGEKGKGAPKRILRSSSHLCRDSVPIARERKGQRLTTAFLETESASGFGKEGRNREQHSFVFSLFLLCFVCFAVRPRAMSVERVALATLLDLPSWN